MKYILAATWLTLIAIAVLTIFVCACLTSPAFLAIAVAVLGMVLTVWSVETLWGKSRL